MNISPETFYPWGCDAKDRQHIVLFTPGIRIKASEKKLQGKKLPSKGRKNSQSGLTLNQRGHADKKVVCLLWGLASLLAWALHRLRFKHGMVATPFSCLPTLGFYVSLMPQPSSLCATLPGKEKNYFSPVRAFLIRQSLPISLSRQCWLALRNMFNHRPVGNISSHSGPWEPLEFHFIRTKT